jgi:hypothetical protein
MKCNVVVGKASAHNELICKFSSASLMKNDFAPLLCALFCFLVSRQSFLYLSPMMFYLRRQCFGGSSRVLIGDVGAF